MIAWMQGVLRAKSPPTLLLDVNGIGYEVESPMTTFYDLPDLNAQVALHCHQVIREDAHHLYGFIRAQDRDIFRMLLKVNGVGAKLGLAILSGMDATGLHRAVIAGDIAGLSKLPGIGKKTAERLVMEMRDRLDGLNAPISYQAGAAGGDTRALPMASQDPVAEAVNALIALGLKPPEASRRVQSVEEPGLVCEEIVRRALQTMAR